MILINKTQEPRSWTEHRTTPGSKYGPTADLREQLLKDQGYICAYCMRRIPVEDDDPTHTSRIEHIVPQNLLTIEEAMDYGNMVICCPGAIDKETTEPHIHCDRLKSNTPIHFSPLDAHAMATIRYTSLAAIESNDPTIDNDIKTVLNLNRPRLRGNRYAAWQEVINVLGKDGKWKKADVNRIYRKYCTKDANGLLPPYCGIVRYHLSRWLSRH